MGFLILVDKEPKPLTSILSPFSRDSAIAFKINSNEASPYNIKGVALYQLGQFNNAIEYYDKAINIKSDFFEAYLNRGKLIKM